MKANNFVKIVFLIFITILKIQAQLGYVTCNPPSFHSYNFSTNTFTSLANTPVSFGSGGNLVYDGTNVFAMAGAASGIGRTNFYKYTVATNTWTTMSPLPIAANTGASMLFIGGFLYAQVANSTNAFYKYDIPNNAWSGLASLPGNIDTGGDLDWDGGDYIYSTQGANGSNGFYRYSINGNSWTTLAPTTFGMRDGGSIKYHSSGYIYALRGGGSRIFARYDIASNTWSDAVVTDTPVDVNDGSALVLYNNKFYTPAGDGTTTFIVYDLSTNTWSTSAAPPPSPFPSAIGNGGHMVSNFEIVTPEICTNGIDDDGDGLVDCADPDCQNLNVLQNGQMDRALGVSNGSPAAPDGWLPGTGSPDVNNPSLNSPYGSGQYRVATWNAGYGNASNYCGLVTGFSVSIAGFGGNESISQTNINTIAGQTYDIHIRWANPGVPGSADPARLVLGFLGQGGAVYSSTQSSGATWYDETLTFTATTTASNATFYLSAESTVSLSYVEVDYIVIVPTGTYFSSSTPDVNYDCMVDCPAIVPEICTNGIDDDGDGLVDCADPDCTPCASLRGDCDGNGVVNSADLTAISTEIFDGDGNTVAAVAGGTYVGTCGCDANGNGTIDAGDLSCASFLISNPGVYPPCMVDPCYGCLIADAGVTITCTPPNYTIFCNPTGSGLAGKFYNITGDITASNVPFGSPQQVGTVQSINGSSVFFTIESTDGNCSIRVVVGND